MTKQFFLLLLLVLSTMSVKSRSTESVLEKLKSGLHLAGKIFNFDQSKGVAELVSEAFGNMKHQNGNDHEEDGNKGVFSAFFRILGINSEKIGAVTVNAIIFVSQLITRALIKPKSDTELPEFARMVQSGSPFEWMLDNDEILKIITHINETDLPDKVIEHIKARSLEEETGCIQLLICKLTPFIWGMQKSLHDPVNATLRASKNFLFEYFPTVEEVSKHGDLCEKKNHFCVQDFL